LLSIASIQVTIPDPLPDGGFSIPLRAAFLVFKMFPLFGVAVQQRHAARGPVKSVVQNIWQHAQQR
jgi:hypothetical protein